MLFDLSLLRFSRLCVRVLRFSVFGLVVLSTISSVSFAQKKNDKEAKPTVDQSTRKHADVAPKKEPLSKADIARKKRGQYFTGLPLISFNPVAGIGGGVRVFWYDNGSEDDILFDYAPYFHQVFAQTFFTSKGRQVHWVNWDAPYLFRLFNRWFRARSLFYYEIDPTINYYGIEFDDARSPTFTRPNGTTDPAIQRSADYQKSLNEFQQGQGNTAARYNKVTLTRPTLVASVESDVYYVASGAIRLILGMNIQHIGVQDYTGETVEIDDTKYTQVETKLLQDHNAGQIYGFGGSWNNSLRVGISFDSRDFEPDPNRGILAAVTGEFVPQALGSRFGYSRYNFSFQGYYDPIPNYENLVIAARGFHTLVVGDRAPFYALGEIFFPNSTSLPALGGGSGTIRGYLARRMIGKSSFYANLEVRWTFVNFPAIWGQQFSLTLVPFFDIGRAFRDPYRVDSGEWAIGYGAGLRIPWNQATIIALDFGVSREALNFYLIFNHIF